MEDQGVTPIAAKADPSNERSILWTRSLARLAFGLALVPHVSFLLLFVFLAPALLVLRDNKTAEMLSFGAVKAVSLLGLLAPFLAIRVLSKTWRSQRPEEDRAQLWAVAGLVVFALMIFNPFAMITYVRLLPSSDSYKGHSSMRPHTALDQAHNTLRNMAEQDPKKYFPPLSIRKPVTWPAENPSLGYPLKSVLEGRTYYYLGHAVADERTMASFVEVYRDALKSGDLSALSGIEGVGGIPRLGRAAPASRIRPDLPLPEIWLASAPLLIEHVAINGGREGTVLFADGHVEDIAYPGRWPMTEATMRLLEEMGALEQAPGRSAEGE